MVEDLEVCWSPRTSRPSAHILTNVALFVLVTGREPNLSHISKAQQAGAEQFFARHEEPDRAGQWPAGSAWTHDNALCEVGKRFSD